MTNTTNKTPGAAAANAGQQGYSIKKLCLLLAVLAFAVYANTLQNGYVLDDITVITKNSIVTKGFSGIPELLVTPRLKGFELTNDAESYRPLPLILSAIEYQLFGPNAAENHLSNVLLFVGCVIALFLFLNKLFEGKKTVVAFVAALLFALHPIHTEVVANIKSRDELMCFLFAFMALNTFLSYTRGGKLTQLLAGSLLLLLSFLCKETVVSFLIVIPFVFFFYARDNRKRSVMITGAMLVATGAFFGMRAGVLGVHHSTAIEFLSNPLVSVPDLSSRIATAIMVLGKYLAILFVPYPLICDYSYKSIPTVGFGNVFVLLSLAVYIVLTCTGIYRLIKKPKDSWAFAILFFLATIALFSNIPFFVYSEMAERFLFFPSVGVCLAAGLAFGRWSRIRAIDVSFVKSKYVIGVVFPVCIIFAALTFLRNAEWKDNYTLFSADAKKSPNNCELKFYLAAEISQNLYQGETTAASKLALDNESTGYLNEAVAIYPNFGAAHAELGRIYDRLQQFDSAIVHDKKAIEVNPKNAIATYNLGRAYYVQKKYADAIDQFKNTLTLSPEYVLASLNLARCYTDYGQYDSALVYFSKTLEIDPGQQIARQGIQYANQMKAKAATSAEESTSTPISSHK